MWDGANLNHGSEHNTTGKSRVSVDFRVLLNLNIKIMIWLALQTKLR